jgi:hypothetical protein
MLGDNDGVWRRASLSIGAVVMVMALVVGALGGVALAPRSATANGSDLPPQIVLQAFVKPEGDGLELLARIPLVLFGSFGFPKRGPGYLD